MSLLFFSAALSLALGTLLSPWQSSGLSILLLALWLLVWRCTRYQRTAWLCLVAALALIYSQLWLQQQLAHRLALAQDGVRVTLQVQISAVREDRHSVRLRAKVLPSSELSRQQLPELRYVQLSWYQTDHRPEVGSRYQVQAKLRSPRGFANGLAFDYEAWLMGEQIDASGYIREASLLASTQPSWRQQLLNWAKARQSEEGWRWLAGLIIGEQTAFSEPQWALAKRTGTLHLLVVSGMHLAFVVLLALALWQLCLRSLRMLSKRNLHHVALWRALFVLSLAWGYLWLANFGVALVRAWWMLAVVMLLNTTRLRMNWSLALVFALCLVLLVNPLAWLSPGFAYSFAAVAALLLFFTGRRSSVWSSLWQPQLVIFAVLLPLFMFWTQMVSPMQIVANWLSIPWVNLLLLPVALLNLLWATPVLDRLLVELGQGFWWGLSSLVAQPWPELISIPLSFALLWLVWLWLWRQGVTFRLLLPCAMLLCFVLFARTLPYRSQALMLDVGQGQALIFTTKNSALGYDAGPQIGEGFDTGDALVRPALFRLGVKQLDTLIVSHNDRDHAGGALSLMETFSPNTLWVGQPLPLAVEQRLCQHAPADWQWLDEALAYRIFNLPDALWLSLKDNDNNRSCVVQVDWYGKRFLLPGDIDASVEQALVQHHAQELRSEVLVLSHHGSRTSSSRRFLEQVAPREVWISAGFHNSYGHPSKQVVARLQQLAIPWRNTAEAGAIGMDWAGQVRSQREGWQPPWRQN